MVGAATVEDREADLIHWREILHDLGVEADRIDEAHLSTAMLRTRFRSWFRWKHRWSGQWSSEWHFRRKPGSIAACGQYPDRRFANYSRPRSFEGAGGTGTRCQRCVEAWRRDVAAIGRD